MFYILKCIIRNRVQITFIVIHCYNIIIYDISYALFIILYILYYFIIILLTKLLYKNKLLILIKIQKDERIKEKNELCIIIIIIQYQN